MKCPRCSGVLRVEKYRGIEVDRCSSCRGMWLDHHELDQLEDQIMVDDELKGTLQYGPHPAGISCPKCGEEMTAFYYRANRLELDQCKQGHGFWLDKGEEQKVQEFMEQRVHDIRRSVSAQASWRRSSGGRGGLLDQLKRFLSGR